MVDFHTHILPGIDDGAYDINLSLSMYNKEINDKVNALVATPHFNPNKTSVDNFILKRNEAFNKVLYQSEQKKSKIIKTVLGAEVFITPGLSNVCGLEKLCIGNSNYILLEMPFQGWKDLWVQNEIYSVIAKKNLIPIMAHIDRYVITKDDFKILQHMLDLNICFQINADCYNSFFGRRRAKKFVRMDAIQFVGSDCHNMKDRMPCLLNCVKKMEKCHSNNFVDKVFQNSYAVINR